MVSGLRVPVGAFEWPEHGDLSVVTSSGSNYVTVGSGDFLIVEDVSVTVKAGVDVYQAILLGTLLTVGYLGLLAVARRIAKFLSRGQVKEV